MNSESRLVVVAPHPDDEVLGVGGTLLRRKAEGAKVAWLIVTSISVDNGWSQERVDKRSDEIKKISALFDFDQVFTLDFPTTQLDCIPMKDLIAGISNAFNSFMPTEVFLPHPSDVHSDHRIVFDAATTCTKWFRYPSIKRVLAYETLSETDFSLGTHKSFRPNVFEDIELFLDKKLLAMDIYASELGVSPFPRSHEVIRALATVRGAASGYIAAEAFQLLKERS